MSIADIKKQRSPNYPAISLPEAIEKTRLIYSTEGTHAGDGDTLVKAMGYSGKNGASTVVLSALKKYELLIKATATQYKLSGNAIDIIEPPNERERTTAIKRAAFAPALFSEMYDEFGLSLPSENNLRNRLLRRGFNSSSLDEVVRAITETWDFVKRESNDTSLNCPDENIETNEEAVKTSTPQQTTKPEALNINEVKFQISREVFVTLLFQGEVTQESIQKLCTLLETSKDIYPTKSELEAQLSE